MKLPQGFKAKYRKLMGTRSRSFLASFERPAETAFRINPLKAHRPVEERFNCPVPFAKWGYYGRVRGRTVDHQSGAVYSQEPSAMYTGMVMNPQPGEKVLDLCAAPGSKTTYLASLMHDRGLLVANEIVPKRARVLASNVERFGLKNTLVLNEPPHRLVKKFRNAFDQVLVDAPCSGEGMFRKNPHAAVYWNPQYPVKCAKRQRRILAQAVKMVKPKGQLVYSTCTFSPEEDEQVMSWLLDNYRFKAVPIHKASGMVAGQPEWANGNPQLKAAVRLFPNLIKGEGHFIAKFRKLGSVPVRSVKKQSSNVTRRQANEWRDFQTHNLVKFSPRHLLTFGRQLYAFNPRIPDLRGLKVVSPGLHLGTFKKNRFEPAYALALALHPDQVRHHLQISVGQWKKYVHGETLRVDPGLKKGWYQLICQYQPVAFGKVVQGTVKNFFPKGLRFFVK